MIVGADSSLEFHFMFKADYLDRSLNIDIFHKRIVESFSIQFPRLRNEFFSIHFSAWSTFWTTMTVSMRSSIWIPNSMNSASD